MIKVAKSSSTFYRICVEGNIGCGKTSILKYLSSSHGFTDSDLEHWTPKRIVASNSQALNLVISPEPVNRWTSVGSDDTNLLDRMYTNPNRWALTFEHFAQFTRYEQMKTVFEGHLKLDGDEGLGVGKVDLDSVKKTMHLMERSIFSNRFCFVENFYSSNQISTVEYHILDQWFSHLITKPETQINKFLYLRTSPETVHERVRMRARTEDEAIPLDYLTQVHDHHERLFEQIDSTAWRHLQGSGPLAKVVVIDANQPLEDVCRQVEKHIFATII